MNNKVKVAIAVVILGAIGFGVWTYLRWNVVFKMKVDEVMRTKVKNTPQIETIKAIPNLMKEAANDSHVPSENLRTTIVIEGKNAGPIIMYSMSVTVEDGSHPAVEAGQGLDRDWYKQVIKPAQEQLEQAGVRFKEP
jgi:hypothetical protein